MAEAFATSVGSNLVSKLGEYLFAPIGRQFGYVLCYKSYLQDLKNGVEKLEISTERVQHSVHEAENNGKRIENDIQKWLESVENDATEARNLLKHGESAKNACFCGWLPNPMVRHPIGRKVKKMTQVIKELQDESTKNIFQKVFYEDTLIGSVTAPASSARFVDEKEDVLESRASITEDVMKAIADNKVCVIGVYGPGGVGKSKLLEDIERRVKEEKLFDVVATANVSRNPDLKRIQGEIAYALGLKLLNDEPTRGRADRLRKRLERDSHKNILIILDNLWEKLELKEIGIPCGYDNKVRGCKLLLTSRYRNVLRNDMVSDREFGLNELKHEEARALFEWTMADRVKDPEFELLVDGVVKNCGGLPLLIVSLAKKLKHGDLAAWRNASTNIEGSDVKSIVELNYNDLKDERIKSLFLICAIESGNILMRDSLIYCLGLGLFKRFKTIENARDRLIMDVHSLQDSSLLLDSDDMEELEMHDIFVDVAISIASTQWNALVGREDYGFKEWSKDELRKCTVISFPRVGIDELPGRLDCPNLKMLLLLEDDSSLEIPESFFESMENLQVLDLTGFSFTSLPSSIEFLENLESLCLDDCFLEDVTVLGKLKGLQFLSFLSSLIFRLPKEIGELTKLRFLDLTGCAKLEVIEPGMLGNLVNLEELYMEDSFDQWEAEDEALRSNASLAELKNMKKLSTLYIAIPYSANLSRDLPFGKLNKYKIQIGDVWDWSDDYEESRTLKLKLDSGNLLSKDWVLECLQKTQDLHLEGLQDGINSFHDLHVEGFRELKHFHVQNNPSFRYVVSSTENIHRTAFARLESLFLENLDNLEKICHGRLAPESFSNLKIVKVDNCSKIKHLFLKRIISQLEEIEISTCHLMQQIVADIEGDADGDEIDDDTEVKSCNLRRLTLQNLSEMMSFCKTADHSIGFFDSQQLIKLQSLEAITIEGCQLIREVFDLDGLTGYGQVEILSRLRELTLSDLPSLGRISNNGPRRILCFQNLRTLKVQNCENLRFLFSSSMAKALGQIKEIEIVSCKLMEEIIDVQEEELEEAATTDTLEFPLLTSLSLVELPNLTTFSYGKYCIHCPSLTELTISKCPKMMTFSSFKGKHQPMRADDSGLSLPSFFNEKVLFPSLEELELSSMCQLKRIWHNQLHGQSFCKLASLTVTFCENLSHIFTSNSVDRLQSLNKIEVVGCPSLEALCEPVQFLSMESVKILHRDNKEKIWCDDLASNAFGKLKTLVVKNCEKLSSIFPSYTMFTRFQNVEKITVTGCGSLEVVFHFQGSSIGEAHSTSTFQLRELVLTQLPKMKHVWSGLPQGCLTFGNLQYMEANECESLKSLVPSSVAKSMTRLEELLVNDCRVEDIIMEEDGVGMNAGDLFFPRLTNLKLKELPELRSFYRNSHTSSWPFLKKLEVQHCSKMRSFSFSCDIQSCQDTTINENQPAFFSFEKVIPHLEQLTLVREDVVTMMPQNYIFCNLKKLVLGCYHDENVPSDFLLQRFPDLEELNVVCSSFEEIFLEDAFGHGGAIPSGGLIDLEEPLKALVNLKRLCLTDLCNLRRVWKDGSLMAEILNQIEVMSIAKCPSLSTIFSYPTSLQSLTELNIWDCAGLVHMGTCTAMTSLVHLTEVYLKDCGAMENVVIDDGNGVEKISFPKLESLILEGLPSLESFSPTNCAFMFPSLMGLVVNQCPKMNTFCMGALRTPKLFAVCLSDEDDEGCWEGDLNTTIQTLSTSCDPY